jgi:hypothetical protein
VLATAIVIASIGAIVALPWSPDVPQRVNVIFEQDEKHARFGVVAGWSRFPWGEVPRAMTERMRTTRREAILPWMVEGPVSDAVREPGFLPLVALVGDTAAGGRRQVRVHVRSLRDATTFWLSPPPLAEIMVRDQRATVRDGMLALRGVPPDGVDLDLACPAGSIDLVVRDVVYGLPRGSLAEAVAMARPATAVPSQEGDATIFTTHVHF